MSRPALPKGASVTELRHDRQQTAGEAAILQTACRIVPVGEALAWFRHDPIRELGERTAAELSAAGQERRVVEFLQSVLCGERG